MPKVSAILVAGGSSVRMGGIDKVFVQLGDSMVIERAIAAFENNALIDEIIVVAARDKIERITRLGARYEKLKHVVEGGRSRFESVQNGVARCEPEAQYVAIHDAARPFVSDTLISTTIKAAIQYGGAAPALRVSNTIKIVGPDDVIVSTPDRDLLVGVQTPQVFEITAYKQAAENGNPRSFDDCQLFEEAGRKVMVVDGEQDNIKITTPVDLLRARQIAGVAEMRVGQGYDVHRLVEGRKLILGGIEIEHPYGLDGHSDADVLVHAIIDALLGAAALGDIGRHFPDSDPKYKDISSLKLLNETGHKIKEAGFSVANIDATVICETPKLVGHMFAMRKAIADAMEADMGIINIKATTEEKLGFTGEEQGIAAQAVALIKHLQK